LKAVENIAVEPSPSRYRRLAALGVITLNTKQLRQLGDVGGDATGLSGVKRRPDQGEA
jgi:hypothetical protein